MFDSFRAQLKPIDGSASFSIVGLIAILGGVVLFAVLGIQAWAQLSQHENIDCARAL